MFGRTALLAGAMLLLLIGAAPAVFADQTIPINQHYTMIGKNIVVYILQIDLASEELSNLHYDVDPNAVVWARIIYQYDNVGNVRDEAFITPVLYDSRGNSYVYDPNHQMSTTVWVKPDFRTGSLFVEIPVPKNATLTQLVCRDGTVDHAIDIPSVAIPVPSPTASPTQEASATPGSGASWQSCLPFVPFAMVFGLAGVGIVINRSGIRKR